MSAGTSIPTRQRYLRSPLLFLLLLVTLATYSPGQMSHLAAAIGQPTTPAAALFATGKVIPIRSVNLSFQADGRVTAVLVAEGDLVKTGDPLIRLDSGEADLALHQAVAHLATVQSYLLTAQTNVQLAQAGVATAQRRVAVAQAQLALVQAGPLPEQIAAAESQLAAAQANVTQTIGHQNASLTVAESQILTAAANLATATAERRQIEDRYNAILNSCQTLPDGSEECTYYGAVEESTRLALAAARAQEQAAQVILDQLYAGATPVQQSAANSAVAVALAQQDVAQAHLDSLRSGPMPEQVAIAEIAVARTELEVQMAEVQVMTANAAVLEAEANVAQAQVAVESAQMSLDRLTLRATLDGVVAQIGVSPGELVKWSIPVITVADFTGWQVQTTDLTELDVAFIELGTAVTVSFEAIPAQTVPGTVTAIALTPELSNGQVVYEITVQLEDTPILPLHWGMTAFVETGQ